MTDYFRIGNRTFTATELGVMKPADIEKAKADGDLANQKRLENIRKGLGIDPQKVTLDVTPKAVASRKEAIAAEEVRIAAENKTIEEDLKLEIPTFVDESEESDKIETKKSKGKKVV